MEYAILAKYILFDYGVFLVHIGLKKDVQQESVLSQQQQKAMISQSIHPFWGILGVSLHLGSFRSQLSTNNGFFLHLPSHANRFGGIRHKASEKRRRSHWFTEETILRFKTWCPSSKWIYRFRSYTVPTVKGVLEPLRYMYNHAFHMQNPIFQKTRGFVPSPMDFCNINSVKTWLVKGLNDSPGLSLQKQPWNWTPGSSY